MCPFAAPRRGQPLPTDHPLVPGYVPNMAAASASACPFASRRRGQPLPTDHPPVPGYVATMASASPSACPFATSRRSGQPLPADHPPVPGYVQVMAVPASASACPFAASHRAGQPLPSDHPAVPGYMPTMASASAAPACPFASSRRHLGLPLPAGHIPVTGYGGLARLRPAASRLGKLAGFMSAPAASSTTDIAAEALVQEPEVRVSAHPMLINGELVQSSAGLSDPVINPATAEAFEYVPHASRQDLDDAVDAAAEAFKTWSITPFKERAVCLLKFAELVEAKADALATALTQEQGKPLANAMGEVRFRPRWHARIGSHSNRSMLGHLGLQVKGLISSCKYYAKIGDLPAETVSEDDDAIYKIVYEPRGVVGGIAVRSRCCTPPLPLVDLSIALERGCHQNNSLADGVAFPRTTTLAVVLILAMTVMWLCSALELPHIDCRRQADALYHHRQHLCAQAVPVHSARHRHAG